MSDEQLTPEQIKLLATVKQVEAGITPEEMELDKQGNVIEPPPSIDEAAAENAAILGVLVQMLSPAMPFLPSCYPPETIQQIAAAYTAVEQKHGWNARQYLSVEVQLAIVVLPPTIQAIAIGRAYFAEKRAQAAKNITPGASDVSPE
jgi:hypothetical protein